MRFSAPNWCLIFTAFAAVGAANRFQLGSADPCQRQPFRATCDMPAGKQRSQFVLRYYLRGSECVSYPYGHCKGLVGNPKLFRYKEECEEFCKNRAGTSIIAGPPKSTKFGGFKDKFSNSRRETVPTTSATTIATTEFIPDTSTASDVEGILTTTATEQGYQTTNIDSNSLEETDTATECHRRQSEARSSGIIVGAFIPECEKDGSFKSLQCHGGTGQCFCVDTDGIEVAGSRTLPGRRAPNCANVTEATSQSQVVPECEISADPGPCRAAVSRWYFNTDAKQCETFTYGGCAGNGNNYPNRSVCEAQCKSVESTCADGHQPLVESNGNRFDCLNRACPKGYACSFGTSSAICCPEEEEESAIAGNSRAEHKIKENRFSQEVDRCFLPKDRGPCDRYQLRFYYNSVLGECKYFFFGGCEGNPNNFEKLEDCEKSCSGSPKEDMTEATEASDAPTQMSSTTTAKTTTTTTTAAKMTEVVETEAPTTTTSTTTTDNSEVVAQTIAANLPAAPNGRLPSPVDIPQFKVPQGVPQSPQIVRGPVDFRPPLSPHQAPPFPPPFLPPPPPPPPPHVAPVKADRPQPLGRRPDEFPPPQTRILPGNRCNHPMDKGPCKNQFERFYWDGSSQKCRQFFYGGCEGNGNNFPSEQACVDACKPLDPRNVCEHPRNRGECHGQFRRFYFNPQTGKCEPFSYGGCGGNGNNFQSLRECRSRCPTTSESRNHPMTSESRNHPTTSESRNHPVISESIDTVPQSSNVPSQSREPCPPTPRCEANCVIGIDTNGCRKCECRQPEFGPVCGPTPVCDVGCGIGFDENGCQVCECDEEPTRAFTTEPPFVETTASSVQQGSFDLGGGDKCIQAVDPGPCQNFVDRYYFNSATGACEKFQYGGCAGNRNHFYTEKECNVHCGRFARGPTSTRTQQIFPGENDTPKRRPPSPPAQPSQPVQPAENVFDTDDNYNDFDINDPQSVEQSSDSREFQNNFETGFPTPPVQQPSGFDNQEPNSWPEFQPAPVPPVPGPSVPAPVDYESPRDSGFSGGLPPPPPPPQGLLPPPPPPHGSVFLAPAQPRFEGPPSDQNNGVWEPRPPLGGQVIQTFFPSSAPNTISAGGGPQDPVCQFPKDSGPCRKYIQRWWYNALMDQCEPFLYGSCGGNQNNFGEKLLCESRCVSAAHNDKQHIHPRCSHRYDPGTCSGYDAKFYFNTRNLRCEQFVYTGCGGNENRFDSREFCEQVCIVPEGALPPGGSFVAPDKPDTKPQQPQSGSGQQFLSGNNLPQPSQPDLPRIVQPKLTNFKESLNVDSQSSVPEPSVSVPLPPSQPLPLPPPEPKIVLPSILPPPPVPLPAPPLQPALSNLPPPRPMTWEGVTGNGFAHGPPPFAAPSLPSFSPPGFGEPVENAPPAPKPFKLPPPPALPLPPPAAPAPPPVLSPDPAPPSSGYDTDTALPSDTQQPLPAPSSPVKPPALKFKVPSCPNGQPAMMYDNGKPVLCLPGQSHCPPGSGCYFSGLDFFCCPEEKEDPYSHHVFGSEGRPEDNNGYEPSVKFQNLQIRPGTISGILGLEDVLGGSPSATGLMPANENCQHAKDKGPCHGSHLRWFFDGAVGNCKLFYYGGCQGNKNNFATKQNCEKACINPVGQKVVGCPSGELPLGGTNPVLCGSDGAAIGCPIGYDCNNGVCCKLSGTGAEIGPPSISAQAPGTSNVAPRSPKLVGQPSLAGQSPGQPPLQGPPVSGSGRSNFPLSQGNQRQAVISEGNILSQIAHGLSPQDFRQLPPGLPGLPELGSNQVLLLVPEQLPEQKPLPKWQHGGPAVSGSGIGQIPPVGAAPPAVRPEHQVNSSSEQTVQLPSPSVRVPVIQQAHDTFGAPPAPRAPGVALPAAVSAKTSDNLIEQGDINLSDDDLPSVLELLREQGISATVVEAQRVPVELPARVPIYIAQESVAPIASAKQRITSPNDIQLVAVVEEAESLFPAGPTRNSDVVGLPTLRGQASSFSLPAGAESAVSNSRQRSEGCPDGSDPLVGAAGQPQACGAGFDGAPLCPAGYFCMISLYNTLRLCCPLSGSAAHAAPFPVPSVKQHFRGGPVAPPGFGPESQPGLGTGLGSRSNGGVGVGPGFVSKTPDPFVPPGLEAPIRTVLGDTFRVNDTGENSALPAGPAKTIARPSLSNQEINDNFLALLLPEEVIALSNGQPGQFFNQQPSFSLSIDSNPEVAAAEEETLSIKSAEALPVIRREQEEQSKSDMIAFLPAIPVPEPEAEYTPKATGAPKVPQVTTDTFEPVTVAVTTSAGSGTIANAFESATIASASSVTSSICELNPNEGRDCEDHENEPRTNLFYFYNRVQKKCTIFFYKGCGGNQNRFKKRSDCEKLCFQNTRWPFSR